MHNYKTFPKSGRLRLYLPKSIYWSLFNTAFYEDLRMSIWTITEVIHLLCMYGCKTLLTVPEFYRRQKVLKKFRIKLFGPGLLFYRPLSA